MLSTGYRHDGRIAVMDERLIAALSLGTTALIVVAMVAGWI